MKEVLAVASSNIVWLQLIIIVAFFVLCVLVWQRNRYYKRMIEYYRNLMTTYNGSDVETLLQGIQAKQEENSDSLEMLRCRLEEVENSIPLQVSRTGLLRYDAFHDTGGELSFSLAMTNARGTGFVLTGIHGREETRVYAKALDNFVSKQALSEEEKQAISLTRECR